MGCGFGFYFCCRIVFFELVDFLSYLFLVLGFGFMLSIEKDVYKRMGCIGMGKKRK